MYLLYGFVFIAAVISGIALFIKGNARKSFYLICSGVNLIFIPLSFFIGAFEINAPDSDMFDFIKGFFFGQAIPLVFLIISILRRLLKSRRSKKSSLATRSS